MVIAAKKGLIAPWPDRHALFDFAPLVVVAHLITVAALPVCMLHLLSWARHAVAIHTKVALFTW
jgi:hypothetical protein